MKLGKHIFGVGAMTGISRIFGFVRDMLIARVLGAGKLSDIFLAAFKLPNLFRDLLGEGALSAIFIPMYTDSKKDENLKLNIKEKKYFRRARSSVISFSSSYKIRAVNRRSM